VTGAARAIADRQDVTMAARVERWPGQMLHRRRLAIWAAVLVFTWTIQQFGRCESIGRTFFMLGWFLLLPLLALGTAIVAMIHGSWKASLRSLGSSLVFAVSSIAAIVGISRACHGLGLGNWPPRDTVFVRRFRDERAVWTDLRDGVLHEARLRCADLSRDVVNQLDPRQIGVRYVWEGRFKDAGVIDARVAWDGRWIKLALWEGTIHHNPIWEKGLLYVDPVLAGAPEALLVDDCTVEDLGDGWYVFED
jgi:hypothetical protein